MADMNFKRASDAVQAEIEELTKQRDAINEKIAKLFPIYDYLNVLCQQSDAVLTASHHGTASGMGLTDAIRHVLKRVAPAALEPTAIRDGLAEIGFNLKRYANVMPPIHNTLKRLEGVGEIKAVKSSYGKVYRWRGEIGRTLKGYEIPDSPDLCPVPPLEETVGVEDDDPDKADIFK